MCNSEVTSSLKSALFSLRLSFIQGHSFPALVSPCVIFLETRKGKYSLVKLILYQALKIPLSTLDKDSKIKRIGLWLELSKIILYEGVF